MSADPRTAELADLTRAQAKRVKREATILVQLATRLYEAAGEDTNDSPEEGTHDRDSRSTRTEV